MSATKNSSVSRIALEDSASIRRQLPQLDEQGWIISDFVFADENAGIRPLFDSLDELASNSPIVFYGEKLTGKTALAITLAVNWSRHTNLRPLCFATGSSFARDYAAAVEIDDLATFQKRFRHCKMLVIDDLEPLATKNAAQDELVATLDHLASTNAPVAISSGKLPASIDRIRPALASRLSAGYSFGLVKPSPSARAAIVAGLIDAIDASLPTNDLVDFCNHLSRPLSAPELKTIVTIASQNNSTSGIDYSIVGQLVHQVLSGEGLSIAAIAKSVAKTLSVKLTDMRGSTRQANIVRARGLAILLSRKLTPSSLQQVGEYFGGRDHSTVLHAFRKTDALVATDSELAKALADVQAELLS